MTGRAGSNSNSTSSATSIFPVEISKNASKGEHTIAQGKQLLGWLGRVELLDHHMLFKYRLQVDRVNARDTRLCSENEGNAFWVVRKVPLTEVDPQYLIVHLLPFTSKLNRYLLLGARLNFPLAWFQGERP